MKTQWRLAIGLATILLLGGLFWWVWSFKPVGSPIVLTLVTISTPPSSSVMLFVITNGYERAILLTDLIVERDSPEGWQAISHTTPTHPQRLATGDTKDLLISPPTGAKPWRLRATTATAINGP